MNFTATKNDEGRTLIKFLIKILNNVPVSRIQKLIRQKDIKINNKRVNNSKILIREHDEIIVYGITNVKKISNDNTSKINFKINFEDTNILVVEKYIGTAIHGDSQCLDQQVLKYLKFHKTDSFTPSHAYRIDKVTSGIVIYGKTYLALRELKVNTNYFIKEYIFQSDYNKSGDVTMYLRHSETYKRMIKNPSGIKCITKFIINSTGKYAILKTGRKHQIRATLSELGFPIYGDRKYGGKKETRVYLHASKITLHNLTGELSYLNKKIFATLKPF